MNPIIPLLSAIYILSVLAVLVYSFKRKIKRIKLLFVSFFLTPLAGSVLVWVADKRIDYEVLRYKCPKCDFTFTEHHDHCPICEKEGAKNKLRVVKRVMT